MKNIFFLFSLVFIFNACLQAQTTSIQLVEDTVTNTFRFQRIEVRQYETVTDTLITDRFPERWLTPSELKTYQEGIIRQLDERFVELSRLRKNTRDEEDVHIAYYDQIQGAGAYLALQKEQVKQALQGAWKLVERNGETTSTEVTVTDFELRRNAQRFGTLTVNDDLTVTLSGYFNFNLTFTATPTGQFRAERAGRLYILRR